MAMSAADVKYCERALKDFFGLSAQRINVTGDAAEGESSAREYLLTVKVDGKWVMLDSVKDAVALTSAE